jgi:hypothetical protein
MDVMLRLLPSVAVLLLAACSVAAETPFTDPIPPAVIGRPLHQLQPTTPAQSSRPRPMMTRPYDTPPVASKPTASRRVASKPHTSKPAATPLAAAAPAAVLGNSAAPRAAKPAVDDRPDPRAKASSEVGQGTHLANKPLDPGAYISSKYQALVRQYYEVHPATGKGVKWKIGEPVPRKASLSGVPDDLRARLPVVPPGHQYVQVDGEVVLLAVQSRMVVDGVPRTAR